MAHTYRDMIYMVMDELKLNHDDSTWETDHIVFLLNKYRAFLLKQRYGGQKKDVPLPTYQQMKVLMSAVTTVGDTVQKISTLTIPNIINFNGLELEASVSPVNTESLINYFTYDYNFITIDRYKYVTINKWIKNCVYCAISYSNNLYMKTSSTNSLPTEVMVNAVLENPMDIAKFMTTVPSNPIDLPFPIEEALVQPIIELTIKELGVANMMPEDTINNAEDDFSKQMSK